MYMLRFSKLCPNVTSKLKFCVSTFLQIYSEVKYLRSSTFLKNVIEHNLKMDHKLSPPSTVRGMKILDRNTFSKTVTVPLFIIREGRLGTVLKHLKKYMLKLDNFKPIQIMESSSGTFSSEANVSAIKKIILNPVVIKRFEDIAENDRNILNTFNINEECLKFEELELTYNNWKADELLKAILPPEKDSLTGYSVVGHIVHVNLREHLLEYKRIIGQILLDKVIGARTVVNKTDIIDNTYRNFKMEILCGEDNMLTKVRENHCFFEFDFSSVYWNPRLCTEHERIVNKLEKGDILYDVFAGVGPFAIPAAKKKCVVLANDLNPESYKWLQHNGNLNNVQKLLKTFNKDGKEFIKEDVRSDMLQRWKDSSFQNNMHITMNLPATAATFLNIFKGLFTAEEIDLLEINSYPVVHLYCFVKGDNPITIAKELVQENLGNELNENLIEICTVRNVSVKKEMMRVTFLLSKSILVKESGIQSKVRKECDHDSVSDIQVKRLCVERN